MGHPISHSTHSGFSAPPTAFGNCSPLVPPPRSEYVCLFGCLQSRAAGVGHFATSSFRLRPPCFVPYLPTLAGLPFVASWACGIGHILTAASSPNCTFLPLWYAEFPRQSVTCATLRPPFGTFGVGHNPDSVSLVRRSHVCRSQHSPFRIVPQRGQVSEYPSESPRSEHWRIFHEAEARSNFTDDSGHLHPEARPFTVKPCACPGCADVLAGEAARNHVNNSPPRSAVKGSHVIPDRERRQKAVILSLAEYSSGIAVVFDSTDRPPSKEVSAKYSPTSSREKCQLIHIYPLWPVPGQRVSEILTKRSKPTASRRFSSSR